ncbi:MAG: flippase-like domain-containing protein [Anaerolineales bacterium]|nr:flippase-like domain-containing protein [Anaerolineales bacterium]MCB9127606.1 flippase-like domain-containing protein [Ardenticatenales bacterium]
MATFPRLWRNLALSLLLALGVVAVAALYADLEALRQTLRHFQWGWAAPVVALTALNLALRYAKWDLYLRWLGVRLRPTDSLAIFLSNFLLILTPGKMGGLMKSYFVRQLSGTPMAHTLPIIVVERLTDGIGMILMTALALMIYPPAWPVVALVVVGLTAIIVVAQMRPQLLWLLDRLEGQFGDRVRALRRFYESSYSLLQWRPLVAGILLGTLSRATEGVALGLVLIGLGLRMELPMLADSLFIAALSNVIGVVVMLPGGLGGTEGSMMGLLTLFFELAPAPATAATLLLRLATFWLPAALGLAALLWKRQRFFAASPVAPLTEPTELSYDGSL